MSIDIRLLENVPLFEGLPRNLLETVAAQSSQRTYRPDKAIVHQADPGETLYIVLKGIVKVSTTEQDGDEVFLAVLAAGDNFGELSLIDSKFRSADVVAQEEATLIAIGRPTFDLLMTDATFARNLLRVLADRNRRANERIRAHCTLDVYGLVARQILDFAEHYGKPQPDGGVLIPIRLTQGAIGDLVGASRERVNQVVKFFREKGCISIDSEYRITVYKPGELQKRVDQG